MLPGRWKLPCAARRVFPCLLLPLLTTMPRLAAAVPLAIDPVPDSRRAQCCTKPCVTGMVWRVDLWHVTGELLALFDDLGRCNVGLPDSFDAFVEQLARAYQAELVPPCSSKRACVHELWYALHASLDKRPDVLTHYHLRLPKWPRMPHRRCIV